MEAQVFTFANSPFVPVTVDFFGLSTGDFICGGQAFFGFPKKVPRSTVRSSYGISGCRDSCSS